MDKKSKVLLWVIVVAILISIGITFYKYIIQKDYIVTARVDCNPNTEDCFYLPCGESECSTEEISYFKLVEKKAYNVDLCDSSNSECKPFLCKEEADCRVIYCSIENVNSGEKCSNPETFNN